MDEQTHLVKRLRRVLPWVAVGLLALLGLLLLLAPSEAKLGSVVKLIYVHGALVWAGLLSFSFAGLLGAVALLSRRPFWYRGTQAAGTSALIVWIVYAISAMAVTGLTWGVLIAWNEPRVKATALILLAALVVAVVSRLVDEGVFTALANVAMGVAPWIAVGQADAIRHPVDPIGASPSASIHLFYWLIVLTVVAVTAVLTTWLWTGLEQKPDPR